MTRISRAVLKDIAGLRAKSLEAGQIAKEMGVNIDTINEAIERLDREESPAKRPNVLQDRQQQLRESMRFLAAYDPKHFPPGRRQDISRRRR